MFDIYTAILGQKSIVLCLAGKEMNGIAIHQDLFDKLSLDAVPYPTVTRILRDTPFTHGQSPTQGRAIEPDTSVIELEITQSLSDESFPSVRSLAQTTCLPKSTVYSYLVNLFGFTTKYLTWVPHARSQNQNVVQAERSKTLLGQARSGKHNNWRNCVILDESWFC
jgi:hypothetical protein